MWLMVVLQVAAVDAFGVADDAFPDWDAVSDGDLVGSDEDVLDEESEHPLRCCTGDVHPGLVLAPVEVTAGRTDPMDRDVDDRTRRDGGRSR